MAFDFGLALGALGLINNVIGQGKADDDRNRALSLEERKAQLDEEQQRKLIDQFDEIQTVVNNARKGGLYDQNLWAKEFADDFHKGAEFISKRTARDLDQKGFRPTDSEYKHRTDKLDRTLAHDLAVGEVGARQNAVQSEAAALQLGNPSLGMSRSFAPSSAVPQMLLNNAEANTPNWGAGVGAMLSLLDSRDKQKQARDQQAGLGKTLMGFGLGRHW